MIEFNVRGCLRFLSHAETLRLFQRACVRADMAIRYSRGFNPHPKLSLPLPRPVGVESDGDLLCLQLDSSLDETQAADYRLRIKAELSSRLPEGIELLSVDIAAPGASLQPCSVTYVFRLKPEYIDENLKARVERLLADESFFVTRTSFNRSNVSKGAAKRVDVRPFLKSIKLSDENMIVDCGISPAGSIRVQEILQMLQLDADKLAAPIRRTSIQWKGM